MRKAFIDTLIELAEKDESIYLLTGDLGFSVLEKFKEKFPERFLNCGVAEQNMMGVAAGLALSGKKPYVYSIVPFVTARCLEQIKNDVCYQNLNVKIIGIGGGFSYGELGATHYNIEDIAILRSLPNMSIFAPADSFEARELVLRTYQKPGPAYLRFMKSPEMNIYGDSPTIIEIGKPSVLKQGRDFVFVANGLQVKECLEVAKELEETGKSVKVISQHTIKPIDGQMLFNEIKEAKIVFTVEEHNVIGGLASAIAEIAAEFGFKGIIKKIAIPDEYSDIIGSGDYFREKYGLRKEKILKFFSENIKKYGI